MTSGGLGNSGPVIGGAGHRAGSPVVFRLFDQTGTIRVKLGADQNGSGLVMIDETTEPGVHIVARRAPIPERKTTSITVTGADGRQRVITP